MGSLNHMQLNENSSELADQNSSVVQSSNSTLQILSVCLTPNHIASHKEFTDDRDFIFFQQIKLNLVHLM